MREIKFRAWDKKKKILYQDITIYDFARIKEHFKKVDEFVKRFELVQFTGLKDKDDKEIYEGDIVKTIKVNDKRLTGFEGKTFKIIFDNGNFECFRKSARDGLGLDNQENLGTLCSYNCLKVIGNIYENPDLIADKTAMEEKI